MVEVHEITEILCKIQAGKFEENDFIVQAIESEAFHDHYNDEDYYDEYADYGDEDG